MRLRSPRYPIMAQPYRLPYRNGERGNNAGQIGSMIGMVIGAAIAIYVTWGAATPAVVAGIQAGVAVGALAGGLAGSLYDTMNAPDPSKSQQSLSDLKVQTSTYGQVIPQLIGNFGGIAGNVFWAADKVPHDKAIPGASGGKGFGGGAAGATQTVYTVTLAIGICDTRLTGPVKLKKIWRDLTLIMDVELPDSGGGIADFSIIAGGSGYAVGDTGGIGGGNNDAGYTITSVGTGGAVTGLDITGGSGYVIDTEYPLHRGGTQPGHGNNAKMKLTSAPASNALPGGWTFYRGTRNQMPDPVLQAALGAHNVPGYRFMAYVVVENDDIGPAGVVHNYTFEMEQEADHDLKDVLTMLCDAADLDSDHRDFHELKPANVNMAIVSMQAIRAAIQELAQDLRFYVVESGRKLKFRPIGAGDLVFAIPESDLDAAEHRSPAKGLLVEHSDEVPLPTELDVTYIDPKMNWQQNTQRTMLGLKTGSLEAPRAVSTTVALSADQAKQLSQEAVYEAWIQREHLTTAVGRKYSYIEPGDRGVINARGVCYGVTVIETTYGRPGLMELVAVSDAGFVRGAPAAPPGDANPPPSTGQVPSKKATTAILMNVPALTPGDTSPRVFVVFETEGSPWPGAVLWRSTDEEASYQQVISSSLRASIGTPHAPMPDADHHDLDTDTLLQVTMQHGVLMSVSDLALYNGQNTVAFLDAAGTTVEIASFGVAELIAPQTYRLSRWIRGRLGTEDGVAEHQPGETMVVLDASLVRVPIQMSERYNSYPYKTTTVGLPVFSAAVKDFTPTAENLRPWSVAQPEAEQSGDDWIFRWYYRSRYAGNWVNLQGVGWDVDARGFRVDIFSDSTFTTVVRSTLTDGGNPLDPEAHKTWVYDAAAQTDDFGSPQSTVYYAIYSVAANGLSDAALLTAA